MSEVFIRQSTIPPKDGQAQIENPKGLKDFRNERFEPEAHQQKAEMIERMMNRKTNTIVNQQFRQRTNVHKSTIKK
ncbi:MAG: hypothetical protein M0P61_04215 [Ignavibacteriaceae bacterium]|jgi:hypothetical protein|nr:hypothetical protein [Ignavibacteriaceae bacterium]